MNTDLYLQKSCFVLSKNTKITEDYFVGKVVDAVFQQLGKGAYGTVYIAECKHTNKIRAIKQIKKTSIRNPLQFVNEIEILKKVDHPNIIKIYETYEDELNYYVVTEYLLAYSASAKEESCSID